LYERGFGNEYVKIYPEVLRLGCGVSAKIRVVSDQLGDFDSLIKSSPRPKI
jgi:hypothetical protein